MYLFCIPTALRLMHLYHTCRYDKIKIMFNGNERGRMHQLNKSSTKYYRKASLLLSLFTVFSQLLLVVLVSFALQSQFQLICKSKHII